MHLENICIHIYVYIYICAGNCDVGTSEVSAGPAVLLQTETLSKLS